MIREYREFVGKSWAYKQGWMRYERDLWKAHEKNPHNKGTQKYMDYKAGADAADWAAKLAHGYFDGLDDGDY